MGNVITIAVVLVVVGFVVGFVVIYNRLIRQRNRTDNSWSQVDVQLRRRYDLIPNLVETVKGYATHEAETFEAVVEARNQAQSATTIEDQGPAENLLGGMLRRLFALAESYPELRASANFQSLQDDLEETENKIAIARQIYNDTVLTYNNSVETIPSNIVAKLTGFQTKQYFEIAAEALSTPQVEF